MKRIFLAVLIIGVVLLLGACGQSEDDIYHYVNEDFGYSVDCPADWNIETLSEDTIGIGPPEGGYNQIQIVASDSIALTSSTTDELAAESYSENIRQALSDIGGTDVSLPLNQRGTDKWDWEVVFTMTYEDTAMQGGEFFLETDTLTFIVFYLYSVTEWYEGMEIIDSFSLIE